MKDKPSRRQWLLGLVGAMFGAGAARALGRWLPGSGGAAQPVAMLYWSRQVGPSSCVSTYLEVIGKVEIAPGPGNREVMVTRFDRDGREVDRHTVQAAELSYHLVPVVEWTRYPAVVSPRQRFAYDSEGRLVGLEGRCLPVMTYTYDGGKPTVGGQDAGTVAG